MNDQIELDYDEAGVLLACMADQAPKAMSQARHLRVDDFGCIEHRDLWAAFQELDRRGDPIEPSGISKELRKVGAYARSFGRLSVLLPYDQNPTAAFLFQTYLRNMENRTRSKALAAHAEELHRISVQGGDSSECVTRLLLASRRHDRPSGGLVDIGKDMIENPELYTGHWESGRVRTGISTGIPALDERIAGYKPGQLIVVGARTSVGKTGFAVHAAVKAMEEGKRVAMFSLEMGRAEIAWRVLAHLAGIDSKLLEAGNLNESFMGRAILAGGQFSRFSLSICDVGGQTCESIAQGIENVDLVIVDYLQLVGSQERAENRTREVSQQTRAFKLMAKDKGIPLILLSQLSRPVDKAPRRPVLSDLRDSGSIEQDADVVLFLHDAGRVSGGVGEQERLELIVAKQRNGPVGTVDVRYRRELSRFEEWR